MSTCGLQAYNNATVLIWVHGASMANLVYMPEGSIGIQIVPRTDDVKNWVWPEEYVRDIANTVSRLLTLCQPLSPFCMAGPALFR